MSWMNASLGGHLDRMAAPRTEEVTCSDCGQVTVHEITSSEIESPDGYGVRSQFTRRRISGGCDCAARREAAEAARLAAEAESHRQRQAAEVAEGEQYWLLPDAPLDAVLEYDLGLDAEVSVGQWLANSRRRNAVAVNMGEPETEYRVVVDGDSLVALCRDADGARALCRRKS
ncbi:MAG: hypothetical protein RBS99_10215 [Rhodospirillales bacterium]|jgi:hypothetical protein|nr:hypothetical protein [Rhodospirillales bacterium]